MGTQTLRSGYVRTTLDGGKFVMVEDIAKRKHIKNGESVYSHPN
jgi:hypothetical protein